MKLVNIDRPVTSEWLLKEGRRFDAGPFLSGAVEARLLLEELGVPKEPLHSLTKGHNGGIYNGPQFSRQFVTSPEYGVPFLGSSSMLQADLSNLPYISKKSAYSDKLSYLEVKPGMTLISCSGTIGRIGYVRSDMAGMWSSQHVMKVVPDPDKIPPGYLYAYLSSKYGVPLVVSGTYGAIIQHIEPEHIATLSVPRFGYKLECAIHEYIQDSADALTRYAQRMGEATELLFSFFGLEGPSDEEWFTSDERFGWPEDRMGVRSLRAYNYDPRAQAIREQILAHRHSPLGSLCEAERFKGQIVFTRVDSTSESSRLLVGQRDAFRIRPDGRRISEASIRGYGLLTPSGTTLVPSQGTLGERELYCRAVYVTPRTSEYAFSGDFYRCIPTKGSISQGYLFAFLRSKLAFRLLRCMSTGGKQQYQHPKLIWEMPVPRTTPENEEAVSRIVDGAADDFDRALSLEEKAWATLETEVERHSR